MKFKALSFRSYAVGNYGSGNFDNTEYILGAVLFRSPGVVVKEQQYQEDHYEKVTTGIWGIATPDARILLAIWTDASGKGGRGCDSYHEIRWMFKDTSEIPEISAEALLSLAPKQ